MNIAIIFAGGTGQRMGADKPKQFLEVYGKPIIIHTLEKFQYHEGIDLIYVACKEDLIPEFEEMIKKYNITKVKKGSIVPGGATGQDSIYNALTAARMTNDKDSVVLIHDGVRPIINADIITKNIESVQTYGSAITCTSAFETPLISYDGFSVDELPKRKFVYTAQAPQSFRLGEVLEAHDKVRSVNPEYTDIVDTCTLMKTAGKDVRIIEGNRGNIKVTTPEDYIDLLARLSAEDQKQIFNLISDKTRQMKLKK